VTLRRLALLAIAALLATGGAFWLSSQRHLARAVQAGDPLLPQLRGAVNDVTEVRLQRGDGSRATLQRGADGWTVLERGYRADSGKVRKLLLDLAALEIVEEKTHDPARYAVLGVEDVTAATAGGTRIDVKKGSGEVQSLIVGKPSGPRESYVRLAGAKPSFLARPQLVAEANPARWLETALLDLDAARLRAATLAPPGKPARTYDGARLPPGLAGALKTLAFDDVRPLALSAGTPSQRARFVTREGLVLDVEGREDGTRRWISITASAEPSTAGPVSAATGAASAPAVAGAPALPSAVAPRAAAVPGAIAPIDAAAEAARLSRRFEGREFEIPAYRYSTLFDAAASGT
jgi:Domain of unknown function (DUF4340)